jgi:hypothetical protein
MVHVSQIPSLMFCPRQMLWINQSPCLSWLTLWTKPYWGTYMYFQPFIFCHSQTLLNPSCPVTLKATGRNMWNPGCGNTVEIAMRGWLVKVVVLLTKNLEWLECLENAWIDGLMRGWEYLHVRRCVLKKLLFKCHPQNCIASVRQQWEFPS